MSKLLPEIIQNVRDVVAFGPQFLWRHSPLLTGGSAATVQIPDVGSVRLRIRESDVNVVRQVFRCREYQVNNDPLRARIVQCYDEILETGKIPTIVDAGAHIGIATLWFQHTYPRAQVVAVEPEVGNFELLKENAGHKSGVILLRAAVGATSGFVTIQNDGQHALLGWAARTHRAEQGVPIVTMADAFSTVKNGAPFIAKIDIEGFESDLFSCNTEWLKGVFVVYIEPHDWMLPRKMTSRTFQRAMAALDFEIHISGENLLYVRAD
jgi:FkbM family methyltransferase